VSALAGGKVNSMLIKCNSVDDINALDRVTDINHSLSVVHLVKEFRALAKKSKSPRPPLMEGEELIEEGHSPCESNDASDMPFKKLKSNCDDEFSIDSHQHSLPVNKTDVGTIDEFDDYDFDEADWDEENEDDDKIIDQQGGRVHRSGKTMSATEFIEKDTKQSQSYHWGGDRKRSKLRSSVTTAQVKAASGSSVIASILPSTIDETDSSVIPSSEEPAIVQHSTSTIDEPDSSFIPSSEEPAIVQHSTSTIDETDSSVIPSSEEPAIVQHSTSTIDETDSSVIPSSEEPAIVQHSTSTIDEPDSSFIPSSEEPAIVQHSTSTIDETDSSVIPSSEEPTNVLEMPTDEDVTYIQTYDSPKRHDRDDDDDEDEDVISIEEPVSSCNDPEVVDKNPFIDATDGLIFVRIDVSALSMVCFDDHGSLLKNEKLTTAIQTCHSSCITVNIEKLVGVKNFSKASMDTIPNGFCCFLAACKLCLRAAKDIRFDPWNDPEHYYLARDFIQDSQMYFTRPEVNGRFTATRNNDKLKKYIDILVETFPVDASRRPNKESLEANRWGEFDYIQMCCEMTETSFSYWSLSTEQALFKQNLGYFRHNYIVDECLRKVSASSLGSFVDEVLSRSMLLSSGELFYSTCVFAFLFVEVFVCVQASIFSWSMRPRNMHVKLSLQQRQDCHRWL